MSAPILIGPKFQDIAGFLVFIAKDPGKIRGRSKETKRKIALKYSSVCLLLQAGCDCEACRKCYYGFLGMIRSFDV